ncbi:hypothetical protein EIN_491050 [Entamoeba invadens IP1]|uniref:Ig-like domain-containing protein n=1 Tax=Entamoeba invadens IP1 TaxID=370355 RepID=A0A0A1U7E3_ENTIV|nr:hypothetical protein EIN_491050 [Entamoeba invadens IP1]ELP88956.1 hypothetical protein EIN_491050 [Entamoeba invadens IP1]|eukprot:XP_004255727.1 hypothetical protein EIN_491050 [Entamoeba invadens IP1]
MLLFTILFTAFLALTNAGTCDEAVPVTAFPYSVKGVLNSALADSTYVDKSGATVTVKAIWYKVTVTEDTTAWVSTCHPSTTVNTKIISYGACSESTATNYLDENDDFENCGTKSRIAIKFTKNKAQFVGVFSPDGTEGNYMIVFESYTQTNINCMAATPVTLPVVVEGTTANGEEVTLSCTPYSGRKGLWYSFKGTGEAVVVDNCGSNIPFDIQLIILEGNAVGDCSSIDCYANNDGGCPDNTYSARVYFKTVVNQNYLVFITSYFLDEGSFQVNLRTISQAIPTICEQAVTLSSFPVTRSAQFNASWTKTVDSCTEEAEKHYAAYFVFKGLGANMVMHTCRSASGKTRIEVLNNCEESMCVVSSTVTCGDQAYLELMAKNGQEYFIRVVCLSDVCDTTFTIGYSSMSKHDMCQDAMLVTASTTQSVLAETLDTCTHGCSYTSTEGKGLWYKFIGTTALPNKAGYNILTSDAQGMSINKIEVYQECDTYVCTAQQVGNVVIGIEESAYAFADIGTSESMHVQIVVEDKVQHDTCANAKNIQIPFSTLDWNLGASTSKNLFCSKTESEGTWYTFSVESRATLFVSTCTQTLLYPSYLAVGSGSCSEMLCMGEADPSLIGCMSGGTALLSVAPQNKYYVFVGSQNTNVYGQFNLKMYTNDPPESSKCNNAIVLNMKEKFIRLTTYNRYSYRTYVKFLDGKSREVRGTYFVINEGYSGKVLFMTCATGTTIPSFISTHNACRGNIQSNYSFPSDIVSSKYADYQSNVCGNMGSKLQVDVDGLNPTLVFVAGYNTDDYGFIDVEILLRVTPLPTTSSSEPVESSSHPSQSSEAHSSNTSDSDEDNNGLSGGQIAGIVIGVIIFVAVSALLIGVVVFVVIKATNAAKYQALD